MGVECERVAPRGFKRMHSGLFCLIFGWGKGGNASCTVAPEGTVCGTPVRLAGGSSRPLDKSAA